MILPDRNSGTKHDQTGAFLPEAKAFARLHGIPDDCVIMIDLGKDQGARAAEVLARIVALSKGEPLRHLMFCGHGIPRMLPQASRLTAEKLAGVVASTKHPEVDVFLAACLTGKGTPEDPETGVGGDGGFADGLRDALCRAGSKNCRVFAHVTAGHATRNPEVRVFEGAGSEVGGNGGRYVIAKTSPLWGKWVRKLRDTDLRLRFHLMTQAGLEAELAA